MGEVPFQREKFRELIVYIAERTADDEWFGDTHLNKVLWWADFDAYRTLGRPVTGARYFKLQYGPAAKPLIPVRDELSEDGDVEVIEPPPGTKRARKTIALRAADPTLFSREELQLVDDRIHDLAQHSATALSRISHEESVGWNLVEMYEDIPYRTALVSDEEPTEDMLARARQTAAHLGW